MRSAGVLAVAATLLATATPATAATWQAPQTLELVRGVAAPQVAVDAAGNAYAAYLNADRSHGEDVPQVKLALRLAGQAWRIRGTARGSADPELAVSPSGSAAVAAVEGGRLFVTLFGGHGFGLVSGQGRTVPVDVAGRAVTGVEIGIDESGWITVVWTSGVSPDGVVFGRRVDAASISPQGDLANVQQLGVPGDCEPVLDVNLRGAAAVATNCAGQSADVYHRPPGGSFALGERAFSESHPIGLSLDGSGTVHAYQSSVEATPGRVRPVTRYARRSPDGGFGPERPLQMVDDVLGFDFRLEALEDGRVVAGWATVDAVAFYAVARPGQDFGPRTLVRTGGVPHALDVVASSRGPALMTWREDPSPDGSGMPTDTERPAALVIGSDGTAGAVARLGARGDLPTPSHVKVAVAVNDAGRAAAVWEQRCSADGAFAVMAATLDDRGSRADPPCQDRRPPKVIAVRRRAALAGRSLRVRMACDEACRLTASARVLRAGKRKPIATAKTRGERRLPARRGRWVELRLSGAEVRRIARAKRARAKVTVRLGVSVRDVYGTGRIWRLRVPLR